MPSTYPSWIFDNSPIPDHLGEGERAVKFFNFLRHPNSTHPEKRLGLPFFWERIIRRIYGPRREDGQRIIRSVFIMIPRGARKTTYIGGGLGLYHTIGPSRRPQGQVLLGAGSTDQAELALNEATGMVMSTPGLVFPDKNGEDRVKVRGTYIEHIKDGTQLKVQSAEGDTSHGTTPSVVIFDELHVYKNRKLWRALQTGLPKIPDSLMVITTTAGRGQTGLAWEEYQYARKVALGEVVNEAYLPVIFEPPDGADWTDPNLWELVNPGMKEGFPDIDGFINTVNTVKEKPADRDDFKQYNLNFWLDQSLSPFVDMEVYDEGDIPVDLEKLSTEQRPCYLGVDIGLKNDLSAIVAAWPHEDESFDIWAWFFCPEDNLPKRADLDRFNYPRWAKEPIDSEDKYLIGTPGNVVDYKTIETKLREICERFNVKEIGYDAAYAQPVIGPLENDGFTCVTLQQGWKTQSPALEILGRAVTARKLRHGGHPVLRWNFDNVSIHTDSAGNRTMHKGQSRDRIDGAVATWMAVKLAATPSPDEPESFWETADDIESLLNDDSYDVAELLEG
jgi:phage terminase large subunit-like protein